MLFRSSVSTLFTPSLYRHILPHRRGIRVRLWRNRRGSTRRFPLNRQRIFTQVPLPLTQVPSNGVLIEPGAQLYEGGNVTIFLLFHNLLLLVCSRHVHILFGMCKYDYISLLLVVHNGRSKAVHGYRHVPVEG